MDPAATALVLVSTFMHAGWNLLVRGRGGRADFVERMLRATVLAGLVPAAAAELAGPPLGARAWACVLGSGSCCGFYYYFLARAYGESDFTVVYPVARALPVVMVAGWDVLLGRAPTAAGWAGIALVAAGCLVVPLRGLRDLRPGHYLNRAGLWMVLTALGTVGYTLLDKFAAEAVRRGPASAARYGYIFFAVSWAVLAGLVRLAPFGPRRPTNPPGPPGAAPAGWGPAALAGTLNFGAYWLVLWAYQLARRTAYLVAFRQFSIVLGVAAGLVLFRERHRAARLLGTALLVAGLVLIALRGRDGPAPGAAPRGAPPPPAGAGFSPAQRPKSLACRAPARDNHIMAGSTADDPCSAGAGTAGRYVSDAVLGGLKTAASIEQGLLASLGAVRDEVAHAECLDEEDRSEVYAILHALAGETESHRRAVEWLSRRLAEGGDA